MKFREVTWYSKLLALILFIALPFIGFYTGTWYQKAITPTVPPQVSDKTRPGEDKLTRVIKSNELIVTLERDSGILKYSGSIQLPTPCHKLKDETGVLQSYPEQVQIRLKIDNPEPSVICTQVITKKEFSGQAQVSEKATVSVYLNGEKVE